MSLHRPWPVNPPLYNMCTYSYQSTSYEALLLLLGTAGSLGFVYYLLEDIKKFFLSLSFTSKHKAYNTQTPLKYNLRTHGVKFYHQNTRPKISATTCQNKKLPNSHKSGAKSSQSSFNLQLWCFSKSPKVTKYLGYFETKIVAKNFKKMPKSGHTA